MAPLICHNRLCNNRLVDRLVNLVVDRLIDRVVDRRCATPICLVAEPYKLEVSPAKREVFVKNC